MGTPIKYGGTQTEAAKAQRARFAKYQEDLAAERQREFALRTRPDVHCSACGKPMAGQEKCCLRSHPMLTTPRAPAAVVIADPEDLAVTVDV